MNITLTRDLYTPTETLGTMSVSGRKWFTMERPWVPIEGAPCGLKGRSCVPAGTYRLEPHSSEAFKAVWALTSPALWVYHWEHEVPRVRAGLARTVVLIHVANWASELRGCISLGKKRVKSNGAWMVQQSADAVNELRMAVAGQFDLTLTIEESPNAQRITA
jgi:hypothetical protein